MNSSRTRRWMTPIAGLFTFALLGPALDAQVFEVARMTRDDVPHGVGQCDIRLMIDDDAEIQFSGTTVRVRNYGGGYARDAGSECNYPFPAGISDYRFEVKDRRDHMRLESGRNRSRNGIVVSVHDPSSGTGRYHFRVKWDLRDGGFYDRGRGRRGNDGWNSGYGRGSRRGGWDGDNDDFGYGNGPYRNGPSGHDPYRNGPYGNDNWGYGGRGGSDFVQRACADAVSDRLDRQHRGYIRQVSPGPVRQKGKKLEVRGTARVDSRDRDNRTIEFNCRIDPRKDRVEKADYRFIR